MTTKKILNITYQVTRIILSLWMLSGGIAALNGADFMIAQIQKLGYPDYFAILLGVAKIIGAILLIFPVHKLLKLMVYFGLVIEVVSASFSYISVGLVSDSIPPMVICLIIILSFYCWWASQNLVISRKERYRTVKSFRPELVTNKGFVKLYSTFRIKKSNFTKLKELIIDKTVDIKDELFLVKNLKTQIGVRLWNLAYSHIAEGKIGNLPFMITFCPVCNSGMAMSREIDGEILNFYVSGVYRGTMIMSDTETHSFWDHITGECLGGYYAGAKLKLIGSHDIMTAQSANLEYSNLEIAVPKIGFFKRFMTKYQNNHTWRAVPEGKFFPGFKKSFEIEDNRRPEKELGLGLFMNEKAKFYPLTEIKKHEVLKDDFYGQQIEITMDSELGIPKLTNHDHQLGINQTFVRWYGFAQTFRNCEIF